MQLASFQFNGQASFGRMEGNADVNWVAVLNGPWMKGRNTVEVQITQIGTLRNQVRAG